MSPSRNDVAPPATVPAPLFVCFARLCIVVFMETGCVSPFPVGKRKKERSSEGVSANKYAKLRGSVQLTDRLTVPVPWMVHACMIRKVLLEGSERCPLVPWRDASKHAYSGIPKEPAKKKSC